MSLEQFAAAFTEPCTAIDGDTAAGMVYAGFHVYAIDVDTLVTKDVAFRYIDKPFSFEEHTFAAPRNELRQYRELESLCEKLDSLNDDIRADRGASLEEYAYELYQSEESSFVWRSELSEWENIRAGILLGETKYLYNFLNDFAYGSELIEELDHYETTYLKERQEIMNDKQNDTVYVVSEETSYSVDGLINYCEELRNVHEKALESSRVGNMMNYEEGFVHAMGLGAELAHQLKSETKRIDDLIDVFSKQSSEEFLENEPSQFNYGHTTAMKLCLNYAQSLKAVLEKERREVPLITVSGQSGTNNSFDVTSVGFDTEKQYTVAEFNQALKKANEKWQENWDGLSYPNNTVIVTVENLHNEPCTYRINLTDADYNSIQDIVDLSPTPMHASISTEKAIEVLNKAEANAREQGLDTVKQDKTFAYEVGSSAPFTVVHLDISMEGRKYAVSEALKDIIDAYYTDGRQSNDMAQPYKNLLEQIKPEAEFIHASQGHLECLKFALRNPQEDKELCMSMLDSIKQAENNLTPVVIIKGYECIPKDIWEDHGVTYKIGQCVDDMSFYYARATDGTVTRDYEYDHEPSREKVMSDHADKLAEEAIDRHEAEYGADGRRAFPDVQNNMVENIPQQRDISHNTTNADLSAKRGESRGNIMEQNTKFEVSTMSKLEGDGPAKAIGTLVVNGEFAVHGIKVVDGKNGLYVAMPSEKRNGGYEDIVFPVTKEARAAIDSAVLGTYEKLVASPEATLKNNIVAPEKPVSMVYAQMHNVDSEKTQTKAAGQITIDKCFVVTGVKLNEGTNTEGQTKTFVAMPGKPNANGSYDDIAHPITAEFHNKVDKAVIASANNIGRYEYKGVKFAELGDNPVSSKPLHPKFADKLMAQLEKAGIAYQAKCAETVVISVKAADKQTFDAAQKELTAKLNGKDKPQQKQEQTTGTQKRTTH